MSSSPTDGSGARHGLPSGPAHRQSGETSRPFRGGSGRMLSVLQPKV